MAAGTRPGSVYLPSPARVGVAPDGTPTLVWGAAVETVREEWLVEDRWWTAKPISRHYFELTLAGGRCVVVFCERGRWYGQRA